MKKPKKSLGQNFLIDQNISNKIANLIGDINYNIIEVGPGTGKLTDSIIKKNPLSLTLIEKDKYLYSDLKEKYKNFKKIKIFNIDALNFDYRIIRKPKIVVSNLPYNISIKLIINWLKMKKQFEFLILMIQKEVAQKMNYKNNSKKNRLNLLMEITSNYNIEFNVSNNVFFPKPKINSSVIKIIPKKTMININNFEIFTREIFKFKRKKLSKVLSLNNFAINNFKNAQMEKRAEDLSTNELIEIFKEFYN